jgi:chemotaxis protein MotA
VGGAVPAMGIVVAVMGVVNVMGSVGEPPAVLGKMIGGALVGTFLGILVSYGFVEPIANQLNYKCEEGSKVYACIKAVLLASMNGYAPQVQLVAARLCLDHCDLCRLEEDQAA